MNYKIYFPIACLAFLQGGLSLLSLYLSEFGVEQNEISMMLPFLGVGGLIGGILGGVLSDKINSKTVLTVMSMSWVFVPFLIVSHSIAVQTLAIFLIGLSLAGCRSVILYIITSHQDKDIVNRSLSIRRLIINLCVAVGSGSIGFILSKSNEYYSYYFFFFGIAVFLSIVSYKVDLGHQGRKLDEGFTSKIDVDVYKSKRLYFLSAFSIILSLVCFSFIPTFYTLYIVNEKDFPIEVAGYVFTFSGLLIVFLQLKISELTKSVDLHYRVISGVILLSVGTYIVQYVDNYYGLFFSVFVWTLGEILLFVPAVQFIIEYSVSTKGKTISVYQSLFSVSDFLSPILGGAIIAIGFSYVWDLSLILGMTSAIIILFLKQINRGKNENFQHQYSKKA
ncbi:MFS transporter [Photobacterium sp. 1_MG-2023]|uniref:MFS transporter n=1 Tax=Photobacterium sp. 1_MG-2023 TaxID=3062646 RepID=UPI0026E3C3CD|nr:MFS transporter [Photobacterium sp. 1_MG-2023]MDO6704950.1 MFS transporter [Photobacterium sp. 1_MG-2023]